APAPATPMTWIRSADRMERAGRTGSSPAPRSAAVRVTSGPPRSFSSSDALGDLDEPAEGLDRRGAADRLPVTAEREAPNLDRTTVPAREPDVGEAHGLGCAT